MCRDGGLEVAATHPGSFEHLRLSVLLWEAPILKRYHLEVPRLLRQVSAQCEDPTLMREVWRIPCGLRDMALLLWRTLFGT